MPATIETLGGRNDVTAARLARTDIRNCMTCHPSGPELNQSSSRNRVKPMFAGLRQRNQLADCGSGRWAAECACFRPPRFDDILYDVQSPAVAPLSESQ